LTFRRGASRRKWSSFCLLQRWDRAEAPKHTAETIRQVRRYSGEGHTPSLQGSLLTSLATAGGEAFLRIPAG
jgi:hypothetical protein